MAIDFQGRVAIVTGAGGGLGRCMRWRWRSAEPRWWSTIWVVRSMARAARPQPRKRWSMKSVRRAVMANAASVTDFEAVQAMVQQTIDTWGRVDILVNNAGIFARQELCQDGHGGLSPGRRCAPDGRGQLLQGRVAAYAGAKLWSHRDDDLVHRLVWQLWPGQLWRSQAGAGLMQTLAIEGAKHDIRVNALAPTAATRMTAGLLPEPVLSSKARSRGYAGAVA
ncbi:SDR family NAD(P)-dependent oxidoreductase [Staphylococcus epidermidis]|nr:SDR family NAD(P)-dependent oxidoreductase [Staphylococcus epidermidis]